MKRFLLYLLTVVSIVACSEGEPADNGSDNGGGNTPTTPTITLNKSSVSFDELADEESISFSTTADWIAEIVNDRADGWLSVTPQSGSAGDASITIKAKENDTPDERNASVRIKAGSVSKTISVSQKQKDALTVTASKFEIEAEGGEVKIEVKANIDFEYAIDESAKEWIKYEGTRAMKTSTLTFYVAENDDTEKREGKIAIKSGEFNEVVTIYQAGSEPSIVISQNEYVVSSDGETISVEVSSNVDVEVEMPADADWISENTTRAASTNTYRFDIQPNEDYDQRSAEIKFTNKENNLSEVVVIKQMQKDAIVLAKSEYEFGTDGGNLDFEVQTNVDITVTISEDATDWIKQVETRGLETKALYFNVAACSADEDREGTITISGGNATQTIIIKQNGLKIEMLEKQREALIALYKATDGDNWTNSENWCSDKPIYQWYGIRAQEIEYKNNTCIVTELNLSSNNLKGNLPESIGNLKYLQRLDLSNNYISGISNSIVNLDNLKYLSIDNNKLSNIPLQIFNIKNLQSLSLSDNGLTGNIPLEIGNLKHLYALDLSYNSLTGEIPRTIYDLKTLQHLYLGVNNLSGNISSEIGNLEKLINLSLYSNNLDGNIPSEIGNLKYLRRLDLSRNHLIGEIPNSIGDLENLKFLELTSNGLTGNIPSEIGNLKNLVSLRLDWNALSGQIPDQLGNLVNLGTIIINANFLTGKIPDSVMKLSCWPIWWALILNQKGEGISNDGLVIPAVRFSAITSEGDKLDDSIYTENEYTILYHYFDWCPYSDYFTPNLVQLYAGYKDKGLGVIAFSTEGTKESYDKYAKMHNTKWPYIYINDDNSEDFFSYTLSSPRINVVDKNGYVVFNCETRNYNDLDEFLLEKLGEPDYNDYEEPNWYTSSDYSKDGEVKQLQSTSKGNGIDIVLMGDGYSDRLIADGTYDKVMSTAMEKFFMEEPYKSFRDYFNVYSVKAVSKNEVFAIDSETAFAGYFGGGTHVGGNDQRVFSYAEKAIGAERMNDALIVVMMNSEAHAGTCYMYSPSDNDNWGDGVSISYFPVGVDDNALAQVLHHEAGGHGFSKLADEYAYVEMGAIPDSEISSRKSYETYGWWKNADFTNDPTKVKWAHFLNDSRYANDGLGVYEGAFTYWTGAYRPTYNSIMNTNTGGFNAPSREAIYYRIHKLAYGSEWEYDYEKFVEYDAINRKTAATTRGVPYRLDIPEDFKPLHPPVVMNTSWRNAKNNAPAKNATRSMGGNAGRSLQKSTGATTHTTAKPMTASTSITLPDGTVRTTTISSSVATKVEYKKTNK